MLLITINCVHYIMKYFNNNTVNERILDKYFLTNYVIFTYEILDYVLHRLQYVRVGRFSWNEYDSVSHHFVCS